MNHPIFTAVMAILRTTVMAALLSLVCGGCGDSANIGPPMCELVLELPARVKQYEIPKDIRISIRNIGHSNVSLVMPGDGSECAWRTPIIGWSVLPLDSHEAHPGKLVMRPTGRCGNIGPLTAEQVFTLKPGESQSLGTWLDFPTQLEAGKYRVLFYYENRPDIKWRGIPLGDHDTDAMDAVTESDAVSLLSEELILEVTKD